MPGTASTTPGYAKRVWRGLPHYQPTRGEQDSRATMSGNQRWIKFSRFTLGDESRLHHVDVRGLSNCLAYHPDWPVQLDLYKIKTNWILSNESIKVELPPWKIWKLTFRALALYINSFDKTKFSFYFPTDAVPVSLEARDPFVWSQSSLITKTLPRNVTYHCTQNKVPVFSLLHVTTTSRTC